MMCMCILSKLVIATNHLEMRLVAEKISLGLNPVKHLSNYRQIIHVILYMMGICVKMPFHQSLDGLITVSL